MTSACRPPWLRLINMKAGELPAAQVKAEGPEPRRVTSEALLGGEKVLMIEHGAELYRLRQTHAGKLILTK